MTRCPLCGGAVETIPAEAGVVILPAQFIRGKSQLIDTVRPCVVTACTECEFLEERR